MKHEKYLISVFDGEEQAFRLHKSLRGFRTNSATMVEILGSYYGCRLFNILRHYRTLYGHVLYQKLSIDLKTELAGDFEQICQDVIMNHPDYIAKELQSILQQFPKPNEDMFIGILLERTNEELAAIKVSYLQKYKNPLDDFLSTYSCPEANSLLTIFLNINREEGPTNKLKAQADAQTLIDLGITVRFNQSASVIMTLLTSRSFDHLRCTFEEYHKLTGFHVWHKLEDQISGSYRERLSNIIQAIYNPELYMVQLLRSAKHKNKFVEVLLNIRLTRDIDLCKKIKALYYKEYDIKLKKEICLTTSGDTCSMLLKLYTL